MKVIFELEGLDEKDDVEREEKLKYYEYLKENEKYMYKWFLIALLRA